MTRQSQLWKFQINGKEYQVIEHQRTNAQFAVWDDFFCVEIDGVPVARKFESLIAALLFILGDVSQKQNG